MVRSKKQLAVLLSRLQTFPSPKITLEQYSTDSETAADVLWFAYLQGDIEGKTVLDAGCGSGILGMGALCLGAAHVTFVDIDPDAVNTTQDNLAYIKSEGYAVDNTAVRCTPIVQEQHQYDTVLQNPPFGTRNEGADLSFLVHTITLGTIVYTFHKSTTVPFIRKQTRQHHGAITHELNVALPLKKTYEQHTKKLQRIEVSVLRIATTRRGNI